VNKSNKQLDEIFVSPNLVNQIESVATWAEKFHVPHSLTAAVLFGIIFLSLGGILLGLLDTSYSELLSDIKSGIKSYVKGASLDLEELKRKIEKMVNKLPPGKKANVTKTMREIAVSLKK